jgi:hypothetical protein
MLLELHQLLQDINAVAALQMRYHQSRTGNGFHAIPVDHLRLGALDS